MFEAFTGTPLILPSHRRVSLLIEFGYPVFGYPVSQLISASCVAKCTGTVGKRGLVYLQRFGAIFCPVFTVNGIFSPLNSSLNIFYCFDKNLTFF